MTNFCCFSNPNDRFVSTQILRDSYLTYEHSSQLSKNNFISLSNNLSLGIVSTQHPSIAKAISSILTLSLDDGRNSAGGHLPNFVVDRVQKEIISPHGITNLWGVEGHRFVLSRKIDESTSEIIASILISARKGNIFFFTGRYNNVRHSTMRTGIDFDQSFDGDPNHRWFDLFSFPEVEEFKPKDYHHIANFVVAKEWRNQKMSRVLLENIIKHYSKEFMETHQLPVLHSQKLLCGKGFWQIGDPPWLVKMKALGFYLRGGAESFFMERPWAPLPEITNEQGKISNVDYNFSFHLEELYKEFNHASPHHLRSRIPDVLELAKNPNAKLQYFQAMVDFT